MRRDTRRHTYGDTLGAVYQNVGEAAGKNRGLEQSVVEVRIKIDGVLVQVAEHFARYLGKTRFGVPLRRGGMSVNGAEVTLSVHQRTTYREVLRQSDQRVVNGGVAVRMIFTQNLADDPGALFVGVVICVAEVVHREQDPAVNGL